jgi:hypothetical protein
MIRVNKHKDVPTTYNIINFDYYHPSQNIKSGITETKFKSISWNLFFVKHKIPCFVLDNLGIKYSTDLKEGGNNYVIDSSFPYSGYGSKLIHFAKDVFDPSDLETGRIMHFSSFMRFINFMLPPMDNEVIEMAKDIFYNKDPFKLSVICSYNIYSNLNAFNGIPTEYSNPEFEWIVESLMDGLRYEEEVKYYEQKILKNGNKSNK